MKRFIAGVIIGVLLSGLAVVVFKRYDVVPDEWEINWYQTINTLFCSRPSAL